MLHHSELWSVLACKRETVQQSNPSWRDTKSGWVRAYLYLSPRFIFTLHTKRRITAHQQCIKRSTFKHVQDYIFIYLPPFFLPGRPNQLHLLFAQMSTTAHVMMMMSPCQAWPSPLRLKTSSMSKRWVVNILIKTVMLREIRRMLKVTVPAYSV